MKPSLPTSTPDPARAAALEQARADYAYDFSYHDICFLAELPKSQKFPARYMAKGAEATIALKANAAAAKVADVLDGKKQIPYDRLYPLLTNPLIEPHDTDWSFAWQRLAGPSPVVLKRLTTLPDWLPVSDADLAAVGSNLRLEEALERGALYVADYEAFEGCTGGVTDGAQKYIWAPVALHVVNPDAPGQLVPVAIQVNGHGGGSDTLFRPSDGDAWKMARLTVQIADENFQGVVAHVGFCHFVMQRFIISAYRNLPPMHPLMLLLDPHFEFTLAVNDYARSYVLSVGGSQDRLLGPLLDQQIDVMRAAIDAVRITDLDPALEFASRGVGDTDALPVYPFRDDLLPVAAATKRFVASYVKLYYRSNEDVAGDSELAAFVREVGAADGGRAPNLVADVQLDTPDDVVDLISRLIVRCSSYHAAINDSNYDYTYPPNQPTAGFAPFPGASDVDAMLPSADFCLEVMDSTYQVKELHLNKLGEYPRGQFSDRQVRPLIDTFQAELASVEEQTAARDAGRPIRYPFLYPSVITRSINA